MHAEELWTAPSLSARALRTLLTPASWLYALGWQAYLAVYSLGLKKAKEPHRPVVCIGNLLVGGTGKTPVTLHVAAMLRELGHEVVISCSGYGSPASESATLAPAGELNASKWGDEAALIRLLEPEIPLVVGRNRVRAAQILHDMNSCAVMLMDDGFQHLPLKKHVAIVLDPPQPNTRCLPAGPYREPRMNRTRATLVIPNGFRVEADPVETDPPVSGPIDVLCALGRPAAFLEALTSAGVDVRERVLRPDHDPLTAPDLLKGFGERPILVTGKDWVKLRERSDVAKYEFAVARHAVRVEPSDEFRSWLQATLNGTTQQAS